MVNSGVIPQTTHDIFHRISSKEDWCFRVTVSFIEFYHEQLYDLLTDKQRNRYIVDIKIDGKSIKITGIEEKEVTVTEALQCLTQGSQWPNFISLI